MVVSKEYHSSWESQLNFLFLSQAVCSPKTCILTTAFHKSICSRYNYVTPTSYLELLTTFMKLLGEKRSQVHQTKRRLELGLQKLLSTAQQVRTCRVGSSSSVHLATRLLTE